VRNEELESFGSIPLCIDKILCISIMTVKHNSLELCLTVIIMIHRMKNCYKESTRRGISYIEQIEGRLNGLVISCVRTAF
jgi:hypothetical protein